MRRSHYGFLQPGPDHSALTSPDNDEDQTAVCQRQNDEPSSPPPTPLPHPASNFPGSVLGRESLKIRLGSESLLNNNLKGLTFPVLTLLESGIGARTGGSQPPHESPCWTQQHPKATPKEPRQASGPWKLSVHQASLASPTSLFCEHLPGRTDVGTCSDRPHMLCPIHRHSDVAQ